MRPSKQRHSARSAAADSGSDPDFERERRDSSDRFARFTENSPVTRSTRNGKGAPKNLARARTSAKSLLFGLLPVALMALLLVAAVGHLFAQGSKGLPAAPAGSSAEFDTVKIVTELGVVFVLILINAVFAMAEIALITVRKTRIRQLVEEGNKSAILVERMLNNPTNLMATIQTGVTLISTFSSAIAATSAVEPMDAWLHLHTLGFLAHYSHSIAIVVVTLPVAVLSLVVGEIAPKSLAVRNNERLSLLFVHPIRALQFVMAPVVIVLTLLSNILVRPFGGTATFTQSAVNEEELKMLVEASEEQGVLEAEETEMIHSILSFGDTVARKVMTPRIDLTAASADTPLRELVLLINTSGHSRIPIYEESLDAIVGILHAKDLLPLLLGADRNEVSIREVMRPAYTIPETKKVDELLSEFQRSKQQIAIVSDEYGVTAGLVTIEDLLEEIVGDIQDEYDLDEPPVLVVDGNTTILDGRMSLSDVNERMGLDLPEEEADTIGGYVFGLLGHQAAAGESSQWDGVTFYVEATDGRRITKVRVVKILDQEDGSDQDGYEPYNDHPAERSAH